MSWTNEHPDCGVPDIIANDPELVDISWHNDIAASFVTKAFMDTDPHATDEGSAKEIRLWVHPDEPEEREDPSFPRFLVCTNGGKELYAGHDETAAVSMLKTSDAQRDAIRNHALMEDDLLLELSDLHATYEHPGYIAIPDPKGRGVWAIGDANPPNWCAQLQTQDGSACIEHHELPIELDFTDPDDLCSVIRALVDPRGEGGR